MTAAIVSIIAVVILVGVTAVVVFSGRLRRDVADLLGAFDRAERTLVPLVATVRTDRERLAARVEGLTDPGIGPTRR